MIGQSQVTEPLMTALRSDRVGHAYLFSGPRGCGKTTSARILARCLNCAEGPTDTPCGKCDSCVELGRGGGGSLDVVEIDAASHNGVDDARDLRERAIFAPARDRFKIFILDEAHMVTPQGFNALLKLVEEPPDHVKFIFATTEPEKVIGTIRSRTHHYPFRLVPPAAMLAYVEELCETEGVTVESGVLPLVVRAGGGSPRDTLSLLDQLIAGSEGSVVAYKRAVALLGYTHAELLDEVVDAFAATDAAAAFAAIDRVIQTGQDPRRFVDDLLERLRDLIIVSATGQGAAAVLRGVSAEDLQRMSRQAGAHRHGAPVAHRRPRDRHARRHDRARPLRACSSSSWSRGCWLRHRRARVPSRRRLRRRRACGSRGCAGAPAPAAPAPAAPRLRSPRRGRSPRRPSAPAVTRAALGGRARARRPTLPRSSMEPSPTAAPTGPVTLQRMRDAWPQVLARLETISRSSWLLASGAEVAALDGDVLTLTFQSQTDVAKFKQLSAGAGPSEDLRGAIVAVLGLRVKYIAKHDSDRGSDRGPVAPRHAGDAGGTPAPRPGRGSAREGATRARSRIDGARHRVGRRPDSRCRARRRRRARGIRRRRRRPSSVAQFPIDDEPEDVATEAARLRTTTLAPAREGEVLPSADVEPSIEPDEDDSDVEPEVGACLRRPRAARRSHRRCRPRRVMPGAGRSPRRDRASRSATARPSCDRCSARRSCAKSRTSRRRGSAEHVRRHRPRPHR